MFSKCKFEFNKTNKILFFVPLLPEAAADPEDRCAADASPAGSDAGVN
jgi:hypothetical protein